MGKTLITTLVFLAFLFVPSAYADGPIVCASGSGDVTQADYDLSTCGAPPSRPVYMTLRVKSDSTTPANAQMSEGSLTCDVNAPLDGYADCNVTISDGVLDSFDTTNAENYTLTASWLEPTPTPNVYTATLSSGDVFVTERRETYGEKNTNSLLFFVIVLLLLNLVITAVAAIKR